MKPMFPKLKTQIEQMKCNGIAVFVKTSKERAAAWRYATNIGFELGTRKRFGVVGYEIFRTR